MDDTTTIEFLRHQGEKTSKLQRFFLDDVYGILDGVRMGWGLAVVPRHFVANDPEIEILTGKKPFKTPVYLNYYEQPYYTALQTQVLSLLKAGSRKYL